MTRYTLLAAVLLGLVGPLQAQERGYRPPTPEVRAALYKEAADRNGHRMAMLGKFQALPAAFDCRDKGWVLPIGDQGNCGSCYLYSTIYGTLSQAFVKAGYGKPDGSLTMAVQYGMDRPRNFGGCGGGNGTEVIAWVLKNGWVAERWTDLNGAVHKDYPTYEARSASDRTVSGAKVWKPAGWGYATSDQSNRPATTDEIKTALFNYGPLNVSLDAGGQFGNGTGTITSLGSSIDHEIELVAWDDNKDGGAFLLKNQWSTQWGNQGYRWCTYSACKRLVDVFWVSATPLPPPPPPPDPIPVPGKFTPPFFLQSPKRILGPFADLTAAQAAGQTLANTDQAPVTVLDSTNATVQVIQPAPPGAVKTLTLGPEWGADAGPWEMRRPANWPKLPAVIDVPEPPLAKKAASFETGKAIAKALGLPLVVAVGCAAPAGEWVTFETAEHKGVPGPALCVYEWHGESWWMIAGTPSSSVPSLLKSLRAKE